MRTLLALVLSPVAGALALAAAAPALMFAGLDDTPPDRFWENFPAIVLVGTAIAYVVTVVFAPLVHFRMWTRDRLALSDYVLAGLVLGAGTPLFLIALDGFSARPTDAAALATLGASAGSATAGAFWVLAVRDRVPRESRSHE